MDPHAYTAMCLELEKTAFSGSMGARVRQLAKRRLRRTGRAVGEFVKAQKHGFTGKGGEVLTAGLNRQRRALNIAAHRTTDPKKLESLRKGLKDVGREIDTVSAARKAGITSIPGIAKGLRTDPRGTAKAMGRHFMSGGTTGKAMAVGMPAVMAGLDLRRGDESASGGSTVGQKLVRHGVGLGASVATGGLSLVPGMLASSVLESGSQAAARGAGRLASKGTQALHATGRAAAAQAGRTLAGQASTNRMIT